MRPQSLTWILFSVFALQSEFAAASVTPSKRAGMGATPYEGGTRFRVWAPNAKALYVTGDFNGWSETATPLASEGNGNFSADVNGASAGDKYKYVIVSSTGQKFVKADPRAAWMENSAGSSIVHDADAYAWKTKSYKTPGFNQQIIYEMHIGTFNNKNGDAAPGTWKMAAEKLDYLQDLGVTMLQVMPPMEFPGDYSWGYNPSYPFAPESAYGTPEDMKAFIDGAHARGMGVIIDVVHNHYGPSDLAAWCFDGPCFGNGGIYFYTDYRSSTPWGNTRPDYGRNEVRDFIKDSAFMWLNEYRADGLRFDATKYIRTTDGTKGLADGWGLLRWISDEVKKSQPWKILIAEDFGGDAVTRPTPNGGAGFDAQWAGEFTHPVRSALTAPADSSRDMNSIAASIGQAFNGQAFQRVIYTESHDEVANGHSRLPEEIWPGNAGSRESKKRSTLGAVLALTSPGIPMIFEGQEFLEDGWFSDHNNVDWSKLKTYSGIRTMYRDLMRLRRNWNNDTRGLVGQHVNVFHVNNDDKLIAYHRWDQGGAGDDVIVLINMSDRRFDDYQIGFPRAGRWKVRFNSDWNGYSNDFSNTPSLDTEAYAGGEDGLPAHGSLAIGPYSAVILSQ